TRLINPFLHQPITTVIDGRIKLSRLAGLLRNDIRLFPSAPAPLGASGLPVRPRDGPRPRYRQAAACTRIRAGGRGRRRQTGVADAGLERSRDTFLLSRRGGLRYEEAFRPPARADGPPGPAGQGPSAVEERGLKRARVRRAAGSTETCR